MTTKINLHPDVKKAILEFRSAIIKAQSDQMTDSSAYPYLQNIYYITDNILYNSLWIEDDLNLPECLKNQAV